jgi:hypothetical protein
MSDPQMKDLNERLRFLDAVDLNDEQQWRVTEIQNYMDEGEVEKYWIAKYVVWLEEQE